MEQVGLVAGDDEHLIWNQLISRSHPLKGASLAGRQLRFLIQPELHCANLASHSYRLVLGQVGQDWFARYGLRPGDGPPGPDVMGRGLLILDALVEWQKIVNRIDPTKPTAKKIAGHGNKKQRPHFHG